jgi:hypothetical protein
MTFAETIGVIGAGTIGRISGRGFFDYDARR